IVAGEKLLADPDHDEQRRVVERFPDAVAVDMESYGVAKGVHLARTAVDYNPLFLVIRGISDFVEVSARAERRWWWLPRASMSTSTPSAFENQMQRDRWRSYAAGAAAAFASEVTARIVATPNLRSPR